MTASNNKKKLPKLTTPRGPFSWPKLTEPDYGTEKFPDADGSYKVTLVLSGTPAQQLIQKIQPFYDEAIEEGKAKYAELPLKTRKKTDFSTNDFYSPIYDDETEEETGEYEFKFKMKASGVRKKDNKKWTSKPALFDAKGNPLPKSVSIWGGTVGKISFEMSPYFIAGSCTAGLSLKLKGAQVIELASGGAQSAKDHGFGEEDGYEADEEFEDETENEAEGEAKDEDGGDF